MIPIRDLAWNVLTHAWRSKHVKRANQVKSNDFGQISQAKWGKSCHARKISRQESQAKEGVDTQESVMLDQHGLRWSRHASRPVNQVQEVDTQEPIRLDQHVLDVDMLACWRRPSNQRRFRHYMLSLNPSSSLLVLISPRGPRESPERDHRIWSPGGTSYASRLHRA